mmetsp:Transcript_3810/g.6492  ORF Transcript_3810/g.6492 Transcript_3810/m.6492 type:complete len:82 (-) Transcript_3810:38-283(-)
MGSNNPSYYDGAIYNEDLDKSIEASFEEIQRKLRERNNSRSSIHQASSELSRREVEVANSRRESKMSGGLGGRGNTSAEMN